MPDSDADARDLELIEHIRRGDEDAFRRLFAERAPTATALALRVVRQRQLAEEIVQEAFLTVWRSPEAYDGARGSFRSWLFTMIHHRAVDAIRREETYRRHADELTGGVRDEQADHADDVVEAVGRPQERRLVRAALNELPAEQREILELMYFDGLSQSQVAAKTGLPLGTVKSRTLLGMRRMRAALEDLER
ncbi:MAG: RNA polymerase sigma factor [Actinomycetota bacterium]